MLYALRSIRQERARVNQDTLVTRTSVVDQNVLQITIARQTKHAPTINA